MSSMVHYYLSGWNRGQRSKAIYRVSISKTRKQISICRNLQRLNDKLRDKHHQRSFLLFLGLPLNNAEEKEEEE